MTISAFKYDHSTGESFVQELEGEDLQNFLQLKQEALARKEAEAQAAAEAAVKRQALLAKLGITEEEARLLLGGN